MAATGLMLWQEAVGFDIVSMFNISIFAVVVALLLLTFFVLAFVYWKRKHSQE